MLRQLFQPAESFSCCQRFIAPDSLFLSATAAAAHERHLFHPADRPCFTQRTIAPRTALARRSSSSLSRLSRSSVSHHTPHRSALAPVEKGWLRSSVRRVPAAVVSIVGGAIVQKILVPHSRVRFSRVILYNNGRRRVQVRT